MINKLKKASIILGIINLTLFTLEYYSYINPFYNDFVTIILFLINISFLISLISFFVISDIAKNKFYYLKGINRILVSFCFFVIFISLVFKYYGFLWFFIFSLLIALINLILMSIIYHYKNVGVRKELTKEWALYAVLLLIFMTIILVDKMIN